jgi:hypothetical protein
MLQLELLEEDGKMSDSLIEYRISLKLELAKILEEEEAYWYRRSHGNWLLKGDSNTEFFHRIANGKKGSKQFLLWQMEMGI